MGCKTINPKVAINDNWKPMSDFNNNGFAKSIKATAKIRVLNPEEILPACWADNRIMPIIPALTADAGAPMRRTNIIIIAIDK